MPTFTFAPVVDGEELPPVQRPMKGPAEACAHGADVLRTVLGAVNAKSAYVAVFDGDIEGQPLGAWDWSREEPTAVWSAED